MKNSNIKHPNRFSESVVKFKNSRINYSGSHRTGQVSDHHILLMLKLVLQVIFYCPQRMYNCQIFSCHHKRTELFQLSKPSHRFSLGMHYCKPLIYNSLSNCTLLGSFNACHLKVTFIITCHAINDFNCSCHFFISQIAENTLLYKDIISLQLSPLPSL